MATLCGVTEQFSGLEAVYHSRATGHHLSVLHLWLLPRKCKPHFWMHRKCKVMVIR
ncbi:hypothetical protein [Enterobacter pseudoroggenkampii]|uniref:hypothetical protein n=1 Tax=Enterobacter pseudoroggenkampii TaxID=2996112 RepID=UPI0038B40663